MGWMSVGWWECSCEHRQMRVSAGGGGRMRVSGVWEVGCVRNGPYRPYFAKMTTLGNVTDRRALIHLESSGYEENRDK